MFWEVDTGDKVTKLFWVVKKVRVKPLIINYLLLF